MRKSPFPESDIAYTQPSYARTLTGDNSADVDVILVVTIKNALTPVLTQPLEFLFQQVALGVVLRQQPDKPYGHAMLFLQVSQNLDLPEQTTREQSVCFGTSIYLISYLLMSRAVFRLNESSFSSIFLRFYGLS